MKRHITFAVICSLVGCGESEYLKCVEVANKSTPMTAAMICAKKHEERLPNSVVAKGLKANWRNNEFKMEEFSVSPGYAVTTVVIELQDKLAEKTEIMEIPTFYLVGHMGSQESLSIRTKTKGGLPSYGWGWKILEVRGVNTLE